MICLAPGTRTDIVIATTLKSLLKILLLTSPLDLPCAPCATINHKISRMPTQPDAGLLARTLFSVYQGQDMFHSRDHASYLVFN
jgi:hypothetical protein